MGEEIRELQESVKANLKYEQCVQNAVSIFDSYARQIAKQLSRRIPMTTARKRYWERRLFHNLKNSENELREVFDIRLFKGLNSEEIIFVSLMFHRRHVYEHNGGEVDEKYIQDSGDMTVRHKQTITETLDSAQRTTELVQKIAENMHNGFHLIFPPIEKPIEDRRARIEYLDSLKQR